MAESVLVPPTPTINQSDSPQQIAETVQNVQAIFDKVAPDKSKPVAVPRPELEKQAAPVQQPETAPPTQPDKGQETPAQTPEEHKVPSFISKALEVPEVKPSDAPSAQPVDEDWPEELPTFKTTEESKSRYKNWREKYNALKKEAEQLRSRPASDPTLTEKVSFLEKSNQEKDAILTRMGIENHVAFQNNVLRPMQQAWGEAAKILKDTGRNPDDLARALSLSGAAQYEALDEVLTGIPESAKIRVNNEIAKYQNFDNQRKQALQNAPQTAAALKKADMERQLQEIRKARSDMDVWFDGAVKNLRDESKFELLQKSTDPDAKWWNDQADDIISNAKKLSEIGDMQKVPYAFVLAASADPLRKLWLTAEAKLQKLQQSNREKYGAEPNLSESGGNFTNGSPQEDLKKPFKDVFLKKFHEERAKGAR